VEAFYLFIKWKRRNLETVRDEEEGVKSRVYKFDFSRYLKGIRGNGV
jgi:hypothetical protein